MKLLKEFIRRAYDNQIVIRIPAGTEISCTADVLDDFLIEAGMPITKNSAHQIYMSKEEKEEYLGGQDD